MASIASQPAPVVWSSKRPGESTATRLGESVRLVTRGGRCGLYADGADPMHFASEAEARAEVERLAAGLRPGASLVAAIRSAARRKARAAWLRTALESVMGGAIGSPGWGARSEAESVCRNLGALLAELARRGFVAYPDASVRQTWQERANEAWIPAPWYVEAEAFVRLEAGRLLLVAMDDCGTWSVEVDGRPVAADVEGLAAAQACALGVVSLKLEAGC